MNKWKWIFVIIVPLFFATGCWDKRDPEDREYMITMGVDKWESGYSITFAPANVGEGEPEKMLCRGNTLAAAIAGNDSRNSRKTELGQLKMIVFGKSLLEDKVRLESLIEELKRSQDISKKVTVLGTDGTAESCIDAMLKEEDGTGLYLWEFYKNTAKEVGVTKSLDMDTFFTELKEQNGSCILPRIQPVEDGLYLGGGVALANLKLATFLDDKEEQGYLFLVGEAEGAVLQAEDGEKRIPLRISRSRVKYDFQTDEMGKASCRVHLGLDGELLGNVNTDVFTEKGAKEMENLFNEIIKNEVENTIRIAKEKETAEFLGLAVRMRRENPAYKGDFWQDVDISIEPDLKIRDTGRIR